MQSLNRNGEVEVKDCIKNYGMIIIDECHRVSAFSFEEIPKKNNSKYNFGLIATPVGKDVHHPIIFMNVYQYYIGMMLENKLKILIKRM